MNYIKLSRWAKQAGINYKSALRYFHAGLINPGIQLKTGTILVAPNALLQGYTPAPTLESEVEKKGND